MPRGSQVHQNQALETISIAYKNGDLVADRLAPDVTVVHESDDYYTFSRDSLNLPETARANGAEANEADFSLSTATYRLQEHALKKLVTDRSRDNADKALDLDVLATEHLTNLIKVRKEVELASLVGSGTAWANATSLTSTFAWSANTTLSNPILFANSAAAVIAQASGVLPNKCLINDPTFRACKSHVSIVERTRYTSPDSVSEAMLARLFEVGELLVGRGIRNTGAEGLSDNTTNSWIWTDLALFVYTPASPAKETPSALYNFTQQGGGTPLVSKWRDDERRGDVVEVSRMYQQVSPLSAAGYLINDTVQ